ncbi:hypothetical protein ACQ5SO_07245 [Rhodovulum sp. DZ06]|uniref:hypothetical protein n=1 Tax=Rhodovulum sp. DZ06 TaxID=3425126 RepID=UPI003D336004
MGRGRLITIAALGVLVVALMLGAVEPGQMTGERWNFYEDWGTTPLVVIAGLGLAIALWRR